MADESDVETTLVGLVASSLYPNGTAQPCAAGVPCQIFRGWPSETQMQAALSASGPGQPGLVLVSVMARPGVERATTRYPLTWQTVTPPQHTLTITVGTTAQTLTLAGTVTTTPQIVLAFVGGWAKRTAYAYAVKTTDTLASIATNLAALIAADWPGTSANGAVITVATTLPLDARIAGTGTVLQEVSRQVKEFGISIWAPPSNVAGQDADHWRNAVAKVIDPPLKQLDRIAMVDGVWAAIRYAATATVDKAQNQGLYRRDIFYSVEYATTLVQTATEIGAAESQVQGGVVAIAGTSDLPTHTTTS